MTTTSLDAIDLSTNVRDAEMSRLLSGGQTLALAFQHISDTIGPLKSTTEEDAQSNLFFGLRALAAGQMLTIGEVGALYVFTCLRLADEAFERDCDALMATGLAGPAFAEPYERLKAQLRSARNRAVKAAYGRTYAQWVKS